jgi:hypothetical protein
VTATGKQRTRNSWNKHKKYIGVRPSQKAIKNLREIIHALTAANMGLKGDSDIAKRTESSAQRLGKLFYYRRGV